MLKFLLKAFIIVGLFLISHSVQAAVLQRPANNLGLVGYWSFNEGTSTIATDFSGNGNSGTLTNMENTDWVAGKRSRALSFDGSAEYVNIPDNNQLQVTGSLTLAGWVYRRGDSTGSSGTIIGKDLDLNAGYSLEVKDSSEASPDKVRCLLNGLSGNSLHSTASIPNNTWTHIACVYNGSTIQVYINGQSSGSVNSTGSISTSTDALRIGHSKGTSNASNYFNGDIDDVRIYNRSLSATEIAALYNVGAQRVIVANKTGLVGYWSFNEGTSTTAGDFSGSVNNGTLTGSNGLPTWVNGKLGKALNFDKVDDYVSLTSDPVGTNIITACMWMYPIDSGEGSYGRLFDNGSFVVHLRLSGAMTVVSGGGVGFTSGNNIFSYNAWNHICVTRQSNGSSVVYVNGQVKASGASGTPASGTSNLIIGNMANASRTFNGYIDEVRIYQKILDQNELTSLYNAKATIINASQNNKVISGLVGLWSFNGADMSGTTVYDRSGQGNNGTMTNYGTAGTSSKVIGKVGQALLFDGVDDEVSIGSPSALALQNNLTVSAWVKRAVSGGTQTIVKRGNASSLTTANQLYQMRIDSTGELSFSSTGTTFTPSPAMTAPVNEWVHFACTIDAANLILCYKNGVVSGNSATKTDGSPIDNTTLIGKGGNGGNFFNGNIDEVRIYNKALSASEVKQLYLMGK